MTSRKVVCRNLFIADKIDRQMVRLQKRWTTLLKRKMRVLNHK